ncbi:hypothetical protein AGMMS49944_26590 [Spirochaetia bacterium]|nr:hypothetical protein AGMMS49944_26590 [Spirochaetia bacterium]
MRETLYSFNGQDISIDFLIKIEHVVRIIAAGNRTGFDEAYAGFLASKTYKALQNPASLLWAESSEFIADEYFGEIE